mmetsp:Transcript_41887/g.112958  ORF Transcript_41887/g.112958 Transcript_41887/m.112958 type:complete len:329 (-) Transcript_41887:84-1070(-)
MSLAKTVVDEVGSTAPLVQEPMIIVCQSSPASLDTVPVVKRLIGHDNVEHFSTWVEFMRWLFSQPRGNVVPWVTLITGWREAKPCVAAISAAVSGDADHIRPDARRPDLQEPHGQGGQAAFAGTVKVAIANMIIVPSSEQTPSVQARQKAKAKTWARSEELVNIGLQVTVADNEAHLATLLPTQEETTTIASTTACSTYASEGSQASTPRFDEGDCVTHCYSAPAAMCRMRTPSPDYNYRRMRTPSPDYSYRERRRSAPSSPALSPLSPTSSAMMWPAPFAPQYLPGLQVGGPQPFVVGLPAVRMPVGMGTPFAHVVAPPMARHIAPR